MSEPPRDWTLALETVATLLVRGAQAWQVAQALDCSIEEAREQVAQVRALWRAEANRPLDAVLDESLAQLRRLTERALDRYDDAKDPQSLRAVLEAGEKLAGLYRQLDRLRGQHRGGGWRDAPGDASPGRGGSVFSAPGGSPAEVSSRAARERFETLADAPWMIEYWALREEGWDWRKAAYIAWASSPARGRWPATQKRLASEVLGLKSDRTIRKWREKNERLEERVGELQVAPLMRHRRDVVQALVEVASRPEPSAHADRKLFLELTRDYQSTLALLGKDGGPIETRHRPPDLKALSDDELDLLARLARRLSGDPGGESAS